MSSVKSKKGRLWAISILILSITGCAAIPNVELSQSESVKIRTIALLNIAEPTSEHVQSIGGGAFVFGMVGGIIQASINDSHSSAYSSLASERSVRFAPDMVQALTNSLTASGYNVEYLGDQTVALSNDGKSDDFSSVHTNADAILVVQLTTVGYTSPPKMSNYEPWVGVRAKMIDAKTKQELYNRTFSGGYDMGTKNLVYIPASAEYQYQSFDTLMSAFDQSIRGLKISANAIAVRIGSDFARGSIPAYPAVTVATPSTQTASAPVNAMQSPAVVAPAIARQPQRSAPGMPASIAQDAGRTVTLNQATQMRSRPTPDASVVTTLPAGAQVNQTSAIVSNESGDWCYIMYGKVQGWISASGLAH